MYLDDNGYSGGGEAPSAGKKVANGVAKGIGGAKKKAKSMGRDAALAAATGGSSALASGGLKGIQGAQKGAKAAQKGAKAAQAAGKGAKAANNARNGIGNGQPRTPKGWNSPKKKPTGLGGTQGQGTAQNAKSLIKKGAFKAAKMLAKSNPTTAAIVQTAEMAKKVKDEKGKQIKMILIGTIAAVCFILSLLAVALGGGADDASATVLPPGSLGLVTINEEDFQKALQNPLLAGVDPNFLRAEVISGARLEGVVPGCRVRWQVMHAIAMHETAGYMSWPVDENGTELQWKIGRYSSGPESDTDNSEWYTDPSTDSPTSGEQWDLDTTKDFPYGAYQMLPPTWAGWPNGSGGRNTGFHIDANADGVQSPHNTYDEYAASAHELCPGAKDSNPATITDFSDPATTDWSLLDAQLYAYAGGAKAQDPNFVQTVHNNIIKLDDIVIGVTVTPGIPGGDAGSCDVPQAHYQEALEAVVTACQQLGATYDYDMPAGAWGNYPSPASFNCPANNTYGYPINEPSIRGCFDCSGLTGWSYSKVGLNLPHNAAAQFAMGPKVDISALEPGDLIYFGSPIHHVVMYIGNGNIIEAPQSTPPDNIVHVTPLAGRHDIAGASRPVLLLPNPTAMSGS